MRAYVPSPIATFTLAFESPRCDETATLPTLDTYPGYDLTNERAVCGTRDFARHPAAFWHGEDPTASAMEVPRLLMSEIAARRVKVVLTGEGADEVFGGYHWFRLERLTRPLARLPLSLRRALLAGGVLSRLRPRFARTLVAPAAMGRARYEHLVGLTAGLDLGLFAPEVRQQWPSAEAMATTDLVLPERFGRWDPFTQLQYYDLKWRLPEFIMQHVDRASMACSLEARLPFLDHEVVELCARLPTRLKMRWLKEKAILRRAMAPHLPAAIVQRPKRALGAPGTEWLRAPLPEFAATLLSEQSLRATGYFEPTAVARRLAAHQAGQADHAAVLLGVLNVQLWETTIRHGGRAGAGPAAGVALHGTSSHQTDSHDRTIVAR
jgi:asparagine synthase (glutamine-hydrolysing)